MIHAFGESITLHSRHVTGQDQYGNDIYTSVDIPLTNVPIWPRNSSELVQGQDVSIVGLQAFLPAGTSAWTIDSITIVSGAYAGRDYEIDGEPGYYRSPFTGRDPGVLVNLTRITG